MTIKYDGVMRVCGDVFVGHRRFELPDGFDNLIINLEGPIAGGKPAPGKINLLSAVDCFTGTFGGRILAAGLANNHVLDYGQDGLRGTLAHLDKLGIAYFGVGTKANRFGNPLILDGPAGRLALLAYVDSTANPRFDEGAMSPAFLDLNQVLSDVAECVNRADHILVYLHWGEENVGLPSPGQQDQARSILGAGARWVIGHHSHCVGPWNLEGEGGVAYSLGNLIFGEESLKAYCDEEGNPSAHWYSRQWARGKASLVLELAADDMALKVQPYHVKGNSLKPGTSTGHAGLKRMNASLDGTAWRTHSSRRLREQKLKNLLANPWLLKRSIARRLAR